MTTTTDVTTTVNSGNPIHAKQGDLSLLSHPVAQELLQSRLPARLAYIAPDGTPRVIPMLFHWTGEEIILTAWPDDPKVAALKSRPDVALTIDTTGMPFHVLSIRGAAEVTIVDGMASECTPMFIRYMGLEHGRAWVERIAGMSDQQARITVRPTWVGVHDFETRFPHGMAKRSRESGVGGRV
jgi:hypothetical protein